MEGKTKRLIAQASQNENDDIREGDFGDQIGCELNCRSYFYNSWTKLYWFNDDEVKEKIADFMEKAVGNGNIGYSQDRRSTLLDALNTNGFKVDEIDTVVECDCSSLVYCAIVYATGIVYKTEDGTEKIPTCAIFNDYFERVLADKVTYKEITEDDSLHDTDESLNRGDILLKITESGSNHIAVFI